MAKPADAGEYLRLTPEFLGRFDWKGSPLTRDGFRHWARTRRDVPLHISVHHWRPLHGGEPVPRPVVEAFSEYLSDVLRLGRFPLKDIAETAPANPPEKRDRPGRVPNAWRVGWSGLFAHVIQGFAVPDEAYCRDEADVRLAAAMVMHNLGRIEASATSKALAIAFAEQFMKRTLDEYARMLLILWQANENTVLFTTLHHKDGSCDRVGVSVVAPLTEAFYRRFRGGEAEAFDVTADDVPGSSLFQLIDAVSDNPEFDVRRDKANRSMDQARTVLFQFASLARPLYRGTRNPRIITQAGDGESYKRLQSYHYQEVGSLTRLTGKRVMEFAPPNLRRQGSHYPLALAQYLAMKSMLLIYQASIEAQRRQLSD